MGPIMTDNDKRILKAVDVARYLGISVRTFYNWLADGRFNVPPIDGLQPRRWALEAIEAWRLRTI